MKRSFLKRDNRYVREESWIILLLTMAAFLLLTLLTQPLLDDWVYLSSSGRTYVEFWSCAGTPISSPADALRSCLDHYYHTNGRLADKLLIFLNLFPFPVGRIIVATCFSIGIYSLLRLAGGEDAMKRPGMVAAMLWLLFLLPPWYNFMTALCCGANYLLPLALCIPTMRAIAAGKKATPARCLMALCAGWMHESFSLGLLTGALVLLLIMRRSFGSSRTLLTLFFFAGTLLILLAPGNIVRVQMSVHFDFYPSWFVHSLALIPLLWITPAAIGFYILRRLMKRQVEPVSNTMIMTLATGMGCLAAGLIAKLRGRCFWYTDLILLASVFQFLLAAVPAFRRPGVKTGGVLGIMLASWLGWICVAQAGYREEANNIERSMKAEADYGIVWADGLSFDKLNPWHMRLAQPPVTDAFYNLRTMGFHMKGGDYSDHHILLPRSWRGKHYSQWDSLPGGSGWHGRFPIFYIPGGDTGKIKSDMPVTLTFDVEDAPLSPFNIPGKLLGRKKVTITTPIALLHIFRPRLNPRDTMSFINPRTGRVPDTLTFAYVEELPRGLLYAPLTAIHAGKGEKQQE